MSNKVQKTIEINAKVKASLEGMEKTVGELEKGLEKQKFDLSKNSGLSKLIKDYKAAKAELDELMSGDVIARTDIKKAEQLGEKVGKIYRQIGKSFEELQKGNDEAFRKLFPSNFTAQISKGTKAIDSFFAKLDSKSVKEGRLGEAEKDLIRLNDELDQIQNRRLKIDVDVDKDKVKRDLNRISQDLDQMRENFKKKLIPEETKDAQGRTKTERLQSSVTTWQNKLSQDTDARKNLKVQSLSKSQKSQITSLENQLVNAQGGNLANIEKKRLEALQAEQTKRATIAKTPGARDTSRSRREYGGVTDKELAAQIAASEKELKRLQSIVDKIDDIKQQPQLAYDAAVKKLESQIKRDKTNLDKAEKALSTHVTQRETEENTAQQKADDFMAGKQVAEATQAEIDALQALNKEKEESLELEKKLKQEKAYASQAEKDSAKAKKESSIEKKKLEIQELNNAINNLANDTNFDDFFKKLQELGVNTEGVDKTRAGLEGIKKELDTLDENTLKEIREALKQMGIDANDTDGKVDGLVHGMEQLGDTDKDLKRAENEMENLKNQVLQFFSLTNAVQLFKRAVTSALNTVKELDATMTEAAVVTEFDVGDMWEKLPQYSAEAQKLGVSINGMYQATTLYYQQGLKNQEAMELGIETMKMGKIASMDSTEATKAMTAALRGFNMELNEVSATKVNDVYSQLAAVTAADTNQIATAMEKTASIAASANMEFETTAALLAQIIETTQEAPETAGTALKTIIARFSEVKSLKEQGQTTGTDSEGEAIDVNKIQAALRTVGISMDGFFAGTEGLDSVLLKLSEKWGTLDFETQRYIATMAAGSRQQSRFIAMMSDYGRTTELVGQAQNSAGASQRQFEKTQESLATSLQRLENAWKQFLMGLTNNDVLKFAVDTLATILTVINKIIDGISGGNGLIKAVTSLVGVIGALKLGKGIFEGKGFGNVLGKLTGQSQTEVIDRKTTDSKGNIIEEHIVKNPQAQGTQAGEKAGRGFVAGFQKAIKKNKADEKGVKNFFKNTFTEKQEFQMKGSLKNFDKDALGKQLAKEEMALDENDLSQPAMDLRKLNEELADGQITAEQAAERYQKMGGSLKNLGPTVQSTTLNLQSMGQASMGVGAALGGLSAIFSALGMDEAAEATSTLAAVFMGLGTVMSVLSTIAPMLGVSFATAGAQITAAGITSQLAWWWVFLIIAAVAALIVLIVALAKAAKENSLEGRMQAAAEATERAKEVAAEAKQAYEDLLSAKEGYDELQEQLDNLTKGTVEWKQALMESNQQVLELLQTYPELAKYLARGEHGQLIISEEGWDKTIEQQEQAVKNASVGVMASQIAESRLQREKIEQDLNSDAFQAGITKLVQSGDYTYEVTDTEDVEAIKKAYAEQGEELFRLNADGTFSQELEDFALSIGQSAEEVYNLATSLGEYNSAVAENEAQLLGQAEAMLMAGTSAETMQYKYGEDVVSGMAKSVVGSSEQAEKDIAAKLYSKDGASESENNKYFQQLMKENGLTSKDMTGDDEHDLEVLYAKMAGLGDDLSKIPDGLKGDKEALAKEIAKIQAGKDAVAQTETVRKNMQKLDEQTQRRYAMAMSGDTTKATRADVEAMKHIDIQKYAETMGYAEVRDAEGNLLKTAAQVMAEAQGIQDVYGEDGQVVKYAAEILADQVHNVSAGIEQEFAKIQEDAKRKGVSLDKSYLKEATAEQLSNYNELLSQALATGGKDGLHSLESSLGSILSQASQDQRDQILSSLGSFDFTQEGEADQFLNFLEGIGLYLPYDQIEKFTKDLQNLGNTFKHISLENIKTEIKDLLDLADSLEGREDSEGLSQEEYEKIIASGVATESQFAWNGQEWLYLDGPLDQLTAALRDNTAALLGKTKEQLQEQIDRGNEVEKILSHTQNGNVQGQAYNELYDTYYLHAVSQEDFLSNKVEDPSFLRNVFGLGSDMTDEQVMQYYKDSIFAYQNLDTNEQAMEVINNRANYMVDTNNINPMLDWGNTQSYEEEVLVPGEVGHTGIRQQQRQQAELALEQGTTVTKGGPTLEQQTQLKALAKEYGVSQATIDDFTKAMKTSNVEQRNAATTAIKNAIEQKKQEKQYGKTLGKLKTVGEEYSTVTKGMQGYDEAIRAYATALGTNDYDFVAENMELIQEAAQGNINSILELNRLLAQEHGLTITADGNFDLYNSKVDMANEATKNFLKSQYEAGAMRLVEITVDQKQEYLVPDGKGGFKMETFDVGQTVQVLQPADAASIERSLKTGGTGSGKSEPVDNPYDKYFNDLEKINDLLRERERLERAYQRLTRKGLRNVHELRRNQQQQLASIREENAMQRTMIANRTGQIQESIQKSKVSKYVQIETNQYGDKSPRIDWDAIDKVYKSGNEKEIEKIEKFLNENQGWLDDIYTREGTIEDNLDKEYELLQQGKEDYMSIEEQIKSAIETNAQKEIDKLSTVNDSINDTNSKLLESMQQQLDEYRQNRSNAKTEEELSDKQRRLAYLQQDTSGANSLEIMQLQEELEQGQEDYTDALIDQKINELQKQNEEAAAQRQQQIDILNDQLRHYIDSGEVWEKVNELLANAIDSEGNIKMDSELIQVLKEANGYDGLSEIGKLDWYKELLSTIANGFNWLKGDGLLASFWEGQKISFTTADGEEPITGTVNADGTVTTEDGHVYSNVRWNGGNNFSTTETTKKEEPIEEPETPALTEEIKKGVSKAIWNGGQGWGKGTERKNKLKEVFGENDIQKNYVDRKIYSGKASDYSYEKMRMKFKGYKTGGLADFTGPAWLDGTKSKPEYILNADQTKAFFTLVDVLSGLQANTSKSAEKTGDNTYDIDINVESIGSDYDVEQIAATIKRLINEDARYRNNNTVNLMR